MKFGITKNLGLLLLGVYLILQALVFFVTALHVPGIVFPVLAIIVGILLILGR